MYKSRYIQPAIIFMNRVYSTSEKIRVRFAPSPTGFLHLGGLRTALYNFLFAKAHNGKFILRIEDTDQTRLVDGAIKQLQEDLEWIGIEIDEGPHTQGDFGPYIQSQRLNIYRQHINTMLDNGSAYHCFCTEARMNLIRKEALKARQIPKYDNKCRNLHPDEVKEKLHKAVNSCIRFKLSPGLKTFNDLIYGSITYDVAANEGDPIILKSDGFPTYHFANVVDDHLMEVSHVLRGVEWQISTNKHIFLYEALNWKPPDFGHLPLLLNPDGSKLSKRQGDIKIDHYRNSGILPLALINYIVSSGGGFDKDRIQSVEQRIYTIDELSNQFDISSLNTHSGKLMPHRLLEFNQFEIKRRLNNKTERDELIENVKQLVKSTFPENEGLELNSNYIKYILEWSSNRITKLSDIVSSNLKFIWVLPKDIEIKNDIKYLKAFVRELSVLEDFTRTALHEFLRHFSNKHELKYEDFMKTLRVLLSSCNEGPGVAEIIEILGKENTIKRLRSNRNAKS